MTIIIIKPFAAMLQQIIIIIIIIINETKMKVFFWSTFNLNRKLISKKLIKRQLLEVSYLILKLQRTDVINSV